MDKIIMKIIESKNDGTKLFWKQISQAYPNPTIFYKIIFYATCYMYVQITWNVLSYIWPYIMNRAPIQDDNKDNLVSGKSYNSGICPICMDTHRNPYRTNCGHVFCYECIKMYLMHRLHRAYKMSSNCPVCRQRVIFTSSFKDALANIQFKKGPISWVKFLKCLIHPSVNRPFFLFYICVAIAHLYIKLNTLT